MIAVAACDEVALERLRAAVLRVGDSRMLAVVILRENFRPVQALGLVFAAIAIIIFSL